MKFSLNIVVALFVFTAFLTAFLTAKNFALDDDLLYFYSAAKNLDEPHSYDQEFKSAQSVIKSAANGNDEAILRFNFRDAYKYNYLYDLSILSAVSVLKTKDALSDPSAYLEGVRNSIYAAAFISHGLLLALFVFVFSKLKSEKLRWAAFATLVLSFSGFLLEYFSLWPNIPYQLIYSDLSNSMKRPFWALFHPGLGFGFFYTNARNNAVIVAAIIFLLRWDNRNAWSYALCFLLSLIHTTSASLILIFLMALDYVHSPQRLKSNKAGIAVISVGAMGLIQSIVWQNMARDFALFSLIPLIIYICLFAEKFVRPFRQLIKINNVAEDRKFFWDLCLLSLCLFVLFLLLWLFFYLTNNSQEYKYTLTELPVRLISLLRFPIWTALFLVLIRMIGKKIPHHARKVKFLILAVAFCLFCLAAWHIVRLDYAEPAGMHAMRQLEDSRQECHHPFSEKVIYYLMACKLDSMCKGLGGEDYMKRCYSAAEDRK